MDTQRNNIITKETSNIRRFITKCLNDESGWFCWYNYKHLLTEKGIDELTQYVIQHPQIKDFIVVKNIETTRPQRTSGQLPEWFRPAGMRNTFDSYFYDNTFIFVTWNNGRIYSNYNDVDMHDLLESLPSKSEIITIKGDGHNG